MYRLSQWLVFGDIGIQPFEEGCDFVSDIMSDME